MKVMRKICLNNENPADYVNARKSECLINKDKHKEIDQ
jgi:hypothetical protein